MEERKKTEETVASVDGSVAWAEIWGWKRKERKEGRGAELGPGGLMRERVNRRTGSPFYTFLLPSRNPVASAALAP